MTRSRLRLVGLSVALVALGVAMLLARGDDGSSPAETAAMAETIVVDRSASCSCCGVYQTYLRDHGFRVRTEPVDDTAAVRGRLAVPAVAASCHTALVGGYAVEGHVPVAAIEQLLRDRPVITGIALPGMPSGAPGMGGRNGQPLQVVSFDDGAIEPYMTL